MRKTRKHKVLAGDPFDGIPDGDMRMVAEVIGPEATRQLMLRLGGIRVHISRPKVFKLWYVRNHYNGENRREVQQALGLCDNAFQELVREMYRRPKPETEQISMF